MNTNMDPLEIPNHPMSPEEASKLKRLIIPEFVYRAVNRLLALEFDGMKATLRMNDIVQAILEENPDLTSETLYKNHWMDFEPAYRALGWRVVFNNPCYNEEGPSTFDFTVKP